MSVPATEMPVSDDRLYRLLGQFQAQYASAIDEDQLEAWPDLFDDACRYIITSADNHKAGMQAGLVYADSKGMLRDRVSALREANIYEQHSYRHMIGQPLIKARDGAELQAETSFLVVRIMHSGETLLFASGRYLDHYRLDGERLLLRERIVVCDSRAIDTLLALPL
ncbi:aromatic-ring-hydroxylating dioxygenase subunit beta [Sphingobium naphthae]|nr:aromatic-ring-hydroxylating dioxygenase subunit beta [Sphingobium naphthae]